MGHSVAASRPKAPPIVSSWQSLLVVSTSPEAPVCMSLADLTTAVTHCRDPVVAVMQQYWNSSQAYKYIPVPVIAEAFKSFRIGQDTAARLAQSPDKAAMDQQSEGIELLVKKKYALSSGQLFAACWQVGSPSVAVDFA